MSSAPERGSGRFSMESETTEQQQQQPSDGAGPSHPQRRRQQPARAAKARAEPGAGAEQAAADGQAQQAEAAAAGPGPAPHADREARERVAAELTALAQAAGGVGTPEGRLVSPGQPREGSAAAGALACMPWPAPRRCACCRLAAQPPLLARPAQVLGQGQSERVFKLLHLAWAVYLRRQTSMANAGQRHAASKQAPKRCVRDILELKGGPGEAPHGWAGCVACRCVRGRAGRAGFAGLLLRR